MLTTEIKAPEDSLISRANSNALLSRVFITRGASLLVRVLVAGSILILDISFGSGTAFTQTIIFILIFCLSRATEGTGARHS